jgi:hypothetical protein
MGAWINLENHRQVRSPLTKEMLAPLRGDVERVQFDEALAEKDYQKLAALLARHPKVTLRVYGDYSHTIRDLEFLRHFPQLRRFWFDLWDLANFEGLRHLPDDVEFLSLGATKTKAFSFKFLERFSALRELAVERHTRDFGVVAGLVKLRQLILVGIGASMLCKLESLDQLRVISIAGGTSEGLSHLPRIGKLTSLTLGRLRDFADLSPVAQLTHLKDFRIFWQPKIKRIPSFKHLKSLRSVEFDTLKGLTDLTGLAEAPSLEEITLVGARLEPRILKPLANHPKLRRARIGLGSDKSNSAAAEILQVPGSYGGQKLE